MSHPLRFTVCTYNLWTWTRWPERRDAVEHFARSQRPDIWCVQELQPESRALITATIGDTHDCVQDSFEGWSNEGNIFWDRSMFSLDSYGASDIGILEPLRRLFWVRLRSRHDDSQTVLVATAHFTWSGHAELLVSEKNARIPQARRTVSELDALLVGGEPQVFMGDLNDANEPLHVLRNGGFVDCFEALGRTAKVTFPAFPTARGPEQTIDWMLHRGPLRCMTAEVIDFFCGDVAPSDHKPVLATYSFTSLADPTDQPASQVEDLDLQVV